MCQYCKGENFIQSTTTYVLDLKTTLIIVRNVPCQECEQCGETYYSDEIAATLDKIIAQAKNLSQEISIIDFQKVA